MSLGAIVLSVFIVLFSFYAGMKWNDLGGEVRVRTEDTLLRGEYICLDGCDRSKLMSGDETLTFDDYKRLWVKRNDTWTRFIHFAKCDNERLHLFGLSEKGYVVVISYYGDERKYCYDGEGPYNAIIFEDGRLRYE